MSPEEWLAQQQLQAGQIPLSPEEWLRSSVADTARPTSPEPARTTVAGMVGAAVRGASPVATGAALGAMAGAPTGVGIVPGAIAGAGAAGLAMVAGDPIVSAINSLFGTNYTLPTQAMEDLLTRVGVPQPRTEAERIIQSTLAGTSTALGVAGAGQTIARAATANTPVLREVGRQIGTQPGVQAISGGAAGMASQAAQEAGAGVTGQIVAGLAGGMAGARVVAPRTPTAAPIRQLPSDLEEAKKAGIRVMTSDIVPPRTFAQKWMQVVGERVPVAGTGSVRQAQQIERVEAVRTLARDHGITDPHILSKTIWTDLANNRGATIQRYSQMKTDTIRNVTALQERNASGQRMLREAQEHLAEVSRLEAGRPTVAAMGMDQRVQQLDDTIARLRADAARKIRDGQHLTQVPVTNTVVSLPRTLATLDDQIAQLENLRTAELRPVINILKDWRSSVQGQNLSNIEMLRRQLGEAFKAPELGSVRSIGERAASAIYRPLVEDMSVFIKANSPRREYMQWRVANARLSRLMDDAQGTVLDNVLRKGDATPEVVNNMLFSTRPSEVAQLYRNLTPAGRAAARTAIITRAVDKAGGIDHVSPDRFANQVRDLGKSINIFFTRDELQRVQGLARIIRLTKRAVEAGTMPTTGVQNFYASIGIGAGALGGGVGGAVGTAALMGTVGGAARIYESAPVRNMLLRIPQTRPGSAEEAELFKRLIATFAVEQQVPTPPVQENE